MRRRLWQAVAFVALSVLAASVYRNSLITMPSAINAASIPAEIRFYLEDPAKKTTTDVKWCLYEPNDGYAAVAATSQSIGPQGQRKGSAFVGVTIARKTTSDWPLGVSLSLEDSPFVARCRSWSELTSTSGYLFAGGIALDRRITSVRATLSDGEQLVVKPSNGFWYIVLETPMHRGWASFEALDLDGRVLYNQQPY